MRAYHGTTRSFSEFSPDKAELGFHFGSKEQALDRVRNEKGARIKEVELDIKNPYSLVTDIGQWDDVDLLKEYFGPANYELFTEDEISKMHTVEDVANAIQAKGYDAIEYENRFEGRDADDKIAYIVFDPAKIKIVNTVKLADMNESGLSIDQLRAEALKYKTADEFVDAKADEMQPKIDELQKLDKKKILPANDYAQREKLRNDVARKYVEMGKLISIWNEAHGIKESSGGMTVYRGGDDNNPLGIWVSPDKEFAAEYGKVKKYKMPETINLLDAMSEEAEDIAQEFGDDTWYEPTKEVVSAVKKLGYDGFENGDNIFIFDRSKVSIKESASTTIHAEAMKHKTPMEFVDAQYGKQYWSGVVDLRDGKVEQKFTYADAKDNDFHHDLLVDVPIEDDNKSYFWIDEYGIPQNMNQNLSQDIKKSILSQFSDHKTKSDLVKIWNEAHGVKESVNESPIPDLKKRQSSIYKLFPEFDSRVSAVRSAGGIRLKKESPGLWEFAVASVSHVGARYTVYMQFPDLKEEAVALARDARNWNKDETAPDYQEIGVALLNKTDVRLKCTCPAFLYWGDAYILTQNADIYGDKENRPPRVRNPKGEGVMCKHSQAVFDQIPFFARDLGSHLKKFYSKEMQAAMDKAKAEKDKFKAVARQLKDKQADSKGGK